MAIVKDWGKIEQFGSIRSTRSTNIMLAAEWNAVRNIIRCACLLCLGLRVIFPIGNIVKINFCRRLVIVVLVSARRHCMA